MKEAGQEEAKMAIESNSVDMNGTPMISVVCDGSWAKRSYRGGGNYNSLSGVATIIGVKSGKVLYLGVKNRYCCVCQRAENRGEVPVKHTCYKNWKLSSTAMEATIIAEGFCCSLEMHNLIYSKMIADGDSSCFKKILDSRPYETCVVQKIECTNHLLRNYSSKLREISQTKGVPGAVRNVIANNILRCRSAITKAVQHRKVEDCTNEEKIINLKKDV
ncbi:hypothetical protein RI129_003082 [Pyrocoelia pectoralis]|uniref:Mutator-like transposase domain-containing protein n=1 Tax=Pyrocoelia pectoralis TaxID=417401 RepID=A0AAN7VGD3_9COLE